MKRLWLAAAVIVCGVSVTSMPGSHALTLAGRLDTSFGGDGRVRTDFTSGHRDYARGMAIQADGRIVAAGRAGGNRGRFALARYSLDGRLDVTFGSGGRVLTDFSRKNDFATDVAIQADGKIVAAGTAGAPFHPRFALARYGTDGTLDPTFGGDGTVKTSLTGYDNAGGVAIQGDGKIVVAGQASGLGQQFGLARYNPDGTLDPTFDADGKVLTSIESYAFAFDVAVQADGKIVAAGGADVSFALARYNPDGTPDTTFGGDGAVTTAFAAGVFNTAQACCLAIQPNGRIVAAGSLDSGRFALARYDPDGTLDSSFGGDGKVTTNFSKGWDSAGGVAIQPDGKIVAAGVAEPRFNADSRFNLDSKFALVRYNTHGILDLSFGGDGKIRTDFTRGADAANAVAIQADGKIVAAGIAGRWHHHHVTFALARYLAA
jgi:uncharacterized delta-60 repeat protein